MSKTKTTIEDQEIIDIKFAWQCWQNKSVIKWRALKKKQPVPFSKFDVEASPWPKWQEKRRAETTIFLPNKKRQLSYLQTMVRAYREENVTSGWPPETRGLWWEWRPSCKSRRASVLMRSSCSPSSPSPPPSLWVSRVPEAPPREPAWVWSDPRRDSFSLLPDHP